MGRPGVKTVALTALWSLLLMALAAQAQALPDFTDLIEEHSPAVVKITVRGSVTAQERRQMPEEQIPEMFREFFERHSPPERDFHSMGSGFIVSEDGYVITNNHVVDRADEIVVRLLDRREFHAEVVGSDPRSDLALLKIDAEDLPTLRFAEPDSVRVGEWVLAIGSPFGLDYSASVGIVSAIGRSIPGQRQESYVPFIQTDVAINPGNSGGPLFNLDGEVVGINAQIFTRTGGSIGLSFAVPAELAQEVIAQLRETGRVERGWLGVVIQDLDRDLARSLGLDRAGGALISQVQPDSPAANAGLSVGDVIVEFDGTRVRSSGDLPPMVGRTRPNTEVPVTLVRRGDRMTLDVEVGRLPDREERDTPEPPQEPEVASDRLGLVVEPLDEFASEPGVAVSEVDPDGPAAEAGLRQGDVITQLGFEAIDSVDSYSAQVAELEEGENVAVRFLRDGKPSFRTIRVGPAD
ncbi:DegQ family serine endoprotease [Marinimicrobium sp. ABcell2]|uniref:DegQ family serine endoprotease n=1 Tax=Marinimicrobium sp. ABcell2 TaxID=3069751 RepID=UPI0027B1ECC1|nr:DegQ family serine endoprotease [Marinimicrobium sp. ABcell2]MDQ2075383.1 DegQ family serine endoprotease [Marinimicrobium sp. ABcell2]